MTKRRGKTAKMLELFARLNGRSAKTTKKKRAPKPEPPLYPVTTETLTVRLALPTMLNAYYRATHVCGHPSIRISPPGREFKKLILGEWANVGLRFEGRLAMRVAVTWPNRVRRDLDGVMKSLLDALEEAGAYPDDANIKLLVVEEAGIEKPGWVDVTLGMKPGDVQGSLFNTNW